jgi:hypothetical protein
MGNYIKINEVAYTLPTEEDTLHSVLNHLDMVKKGLKDYAKMRRLDNGEEVKFSTFVLNKAIISNVQKID